MVSTPVGVRAVFAAVRERPMKRNHAWSSPVAGCAGGVKRAGARWPRSSGFRGAHRSEEHTSELQSLMRISYAVFCLKKKKQTNRYEHHKRRRAMSPNRMTQ